jgi:FlaA1/EpsC-like NDP-sugar epimerase
LADNPHLTGAGGSVGSSSRNNFRLRTARLVLVDHFEHALFESSSGLRLPHAR